MQSDCMPTQSYDKKTLSSSSSSSNSTTTQPPKPAKTCPPGKSIPNRTGAMAGVVKKKMDGGVGRVTKKRRKIRPIRHIDLLMTRLLSTLAVREDQILQP